MIFGFGKKNVEEDFEEEEIELVLFQGAVNGKKANLAANARLIEAGLIPAKELVTDGLMRRSDLIRIDPKGDRCGVVLSVDGINYPGGRLAKQRGLAVTQTLKLLAGLDTKQRRKAQSGGIISEYRDKQYEIGVDSSPVQGGERLVLRLRQVEGGVETPEEIGMGEDLRQKIRELTSNKSGLVLACGAPRSGLTTTAIGIMRGVDAYRYNIYTLGNIGRQKFANVTPFEPEEGDDLNMTFDRCIRVEADVIFYEAIRDPDIAKLVFEKQRKTTIVSELSARDAASGIEKLVEWVGDPKVVAEGLRGMIGQKLIRVLCPACREAYRPNPKLLSQVGLSKTTKMLYHKPAPYEPVKGEEEPSPCRKCGDLGYFGRTGAFELIEMTDAMRELVSRGAKADEIKALAREEGMINIQQDGVRLVGEGKTSLEELKRSFRK